MSTFAEWVGAREPAPPMSLDAWGDEGTEPTASGLTDAAAVALERVLGAPGRVRSSAFDLLAADALVTYACEAALEAETPDAALAEVLRRLVALS